MGLGFAAHSLSQCCGDRPHPLPVVTRPCEGQPPTPAKESEGSRPGALMALTSPEYLWWARAGPGTSFYHPDVLTPLKLSLYWAHFPSLTLHVVGILSARARCHQGLRTWGWDRLEGKCLGKPWF